MLWKLITQSLLTEPVSSAVEYQQVIFRQVSSILFYHFSVSSSYYLGWVFRNWCCLESRKGEEGIYCCNIWTRSDWFIGLTTDDPLFIRNTLLCLFIFIYKFMILYCTAHQVAEGARLFGASTIIGIDINPDKFKIGRYSHSHTQFHSISLNPVLINFHTSFIDLAVETTECNCVWFTPIYQGKSSASRILSTRMTTDLNPLAR